MVASLDSCCAETGGFPVVSFTCGFVDVGGLVVVVFFAGSWDKTGSLPVV